jgi:hypothetical protein
MAKGAIGQCVTCRETRKIFARELCRRCYNREIAPARRAQSRDYYRRNRKAVQAKNRAYYQANIERCRAQQKRYRDSGGYVAASRVVRVPVAGWGFRTNAGA